MHFSIIGPEQPRLFIERNTQLSPSYTHKCSPPPPFLPSGAPLNQNTRTHTSICTSMHTYTDTHTLLRRGLHYTGITKRNVLIKLCRQLQTTKREIGNDVVHQALKENASRGLCMCAYNVVSVCMQLPAPVQRPAVEDMQFSIRTHRDKTSVERQT